MLTKTDLMDPGTDCASILRNEVFPRRAWATSPQVAAMRDLDEGGTVAAAQSRERTFFANHEVYGAPRHRGSCWNGAAASRSWRRSCLRLLVACTLGKRRLI